MDYPIDATKKRLGRLASEIAVILQGKRHASYAPNRTSSDRVLLSNVERLTIGGNKATDKIYYHHTGYMGHLREKTFEQMFAKSPKKVLQEAVRRMLPKNTLNAKRLKNLVFVETK